MSLTGSTSFSDNSTGGIVSLSAPSGGVAQFKGLLQDATADKYVTVECLGVRPMYWTDAYKNLSTADTNNGFMVNCVTGIPSCEWAHVT